jgi:hypothetical protein
MSLGVLAQTIVPQVVAGLEAEPLVFSGTFTTDPTAWAVRLQIRLAPQDEWNVFTSGITVSVTGSGPYTAAWTVPLSADDTGLLSPGLNTFLFRRVDAGYETVLTSATQLVLYGG